MVRNRVPVALLAAAIAVAGIGASRSAQSEWQRSPAAAPDAIQAFVKAALTDRLRANDIPDLNLLQSSRRIGVRDVMPQAGLSLREAALPTLRDYEFFLISPAGAQAVADRRKESIPFIIVDQPVMSGDTATISLGIDIATPRDPPMTKLCCCSGKAEFHRGENGWAFVKWASMVCS